MKTGCSFGVVPLATATLQRLRAGGVRAPLPIQAAAMPRILLGESVAVHSETGSGKTLAYMLPLMARLRPSTPRQVLVVVPSHELALQTIDVARSVAPPDVGVGFLRRHLAATQRETVLVATGKQVGNLLPLLRRDGGAVVGELRSTLHAIVLDEPDAILSPPLHRSMVNRTKRNRWLLRQPVSRALRLLLERRRDGSSAAASRLQLVLASATLSRRSLRDVGAVVERLAGHIGVVVAGATARLLDAAAAPSSPSSSPTSPPLPLPPNLRSHELRDEDDALAGRIAALAAAADGSASEPASWEEAQLEYEAEADAEMDAEEVEAGAEAGVGVGADGRAADGRGPRQGVLRVPMPRSLSHGMAVCSEADKGAVVAALLREHDADARRRDGGGDARAAADLLPGGGRGAHQGDHVRGGAAALGRGRARRAVEHHRQGAAAALGAAPRHLAHRRLVRRCLAASPSRLLSGLETSTTHQITKPRPRCTRSAHGPQRATLPLITHIRSRPRATGNTGRRSCSTSSRSRCSSRSIARRRPSRCSARCARCSSTTSSSRRSSP